MVTTAVGAGDPSAARGWRTALALSALQLGLHLAAAVGAGDPRVLLPHAVAWLHDLALLGLLAAAVAWLARLPWPGPRRVAVAAGRGALVAAGALLALYPRLLQAFLAAPASFLEADAASARVFLRDYLGAGALWPAALALVAGLLAPRATFLRPGRRLGLAAAPLALLAAVALGRDSPNPVVFGLQDGVRQRLAPRAVARIRVAAAPGPALAAPAVDWGAAARAPRYDHVLLVVLEGVTADDFEAGFLARPDGFLARHRGEARYFSRYQATNLDSSTSLVAMTTSLQVPFRAYAAPERWAAVNDAPNLARGLRGAGFRALFVSTYAHQPFVPNPGDWDRVLDRGGLGDLAGWLSLGSSRMEAATEDRAALPAILEFMRAGPRSLVLAELVFGHSPEWRARTGLTPVAYGDRYLTDLWGRLEAAGLDRRTLLVVVSDHGERTRAAAPENYRVPLLLVGAGVEAGTDAAFRSHLDLQAVVAHAVTGAAPPPPRRAVRVVGSTERWIYGELRPDGAHVFLDDGLGRVLAGALDPAPVRQAFQEEVAAFVRTFAGEARGGAGPQPAARDRARASTASRSERQ